MAPLPLHRPPDHRTSLSRFCGHGSRQARSRDARLAAPPRLGRAWGAPGSDGGDRPPAVEVDAAGEHLLEPVCPIVWWIWATSSVSPRRSSGHIPPRGQPLFTSKRPPVASAASAGPEADNAAPAVCSHHGEPPSASPASGNPRLPASRWKAKAAAWRCTAADPAALDLLLLATPDQSTQVVSQGRHHHSRWTKWAQPWSSGSNAPAGSPRTGTGWARSSGSWAIHTHP